MPPPRIRLSVATIGHRAVLRWSLIGVAALSGAACSSGPTMPDDDGLPHGEVSFSFTGDVAGDFDVSGPSHDLVSGAGAHASINDDLRILLINAVQRRGAPSAGLRDEVFLYAPLPTSAGSFPLMTLSRVTYGKPCTTARCLEPVEPMYEFMILSGTVTFLEIEEDRVRGEFSAIGADVDQSRDPMILDISIEGGSFDVPIIGG